MIAFLLKVLGLAREYRSRLILGVVTGIIGGIFEPLMVATVVFVYGLVFPSGTPSSMFYTSSDIRDSASLVRQLSTGTDPLAIKLWERFPAADRARLTDSKADAKASERILVRGLNRAVADPGLLAPPQTNLTANPTQTGDAGEDSIEQKNRSCLDALLAGALASRGSPAVSSTLRLVPEPVRSWILNVQERLSHSQKVQGWQAVAVIGLIPLMILLRNLFSYLNIYFLQWTSIRTITDLRIRLFEHLMNLSASFFNRTNSGELMSRTLDDTRTVQVVISNAAPVLVKDPVTLVGLVVYLLWQQPKLTFISLLVLPLCMVPVLIYTRKVKRSAKAMQTHVAELSGVMAESFTGYRVVKAYNLEATMVARFRATAAKFIGHYMRIIRSMEIPGPLLEFLGAIGVSLVLLYLLALGNARPSGADFLAVVLSIFSMYRPMKNLTKLYASLEQARAASSRVFELLAITSDIAEPANPKSLQAAHAAIEFDAVDLAFGESQVLHQISLMVPPGKLIALVGETGAGKTSLVNLLLRFYDPTRGAVRIGGTDIREVSSRDLRSQIAVVNQEIILFNETIARNIELGRPGASREEIIAAAKHAHAFDFIMAKPEGFETVVGEKGVTVSGGQRQRIAIARAILRNAPILILDEATGALDAETERAVHAALEELMEGRTTICIAHRLSTVQKADKIVVLDKGRIVETGTHQELLAAGKIYAKLHALQFP
jgi:subfamily B ATP-binding cassette protein MsbA